MSAQSPPTAEASASPARSHAPKIVVSLVIAAGFVLMMRSGGLPLVPSRETFATMAWWCVPAYAALLLVAIYLRSYRWHYLLRPLDDVPLRRVLGVGLVGFAAITFAPLRMGEAVRPYMIARGKITFTQALGTVAAERIIDGLILSIFLLVGLVTSTPVSPLPDKVGQLALPLAAVPAAAYGALGIFTCAFVAMGLFYWRRDLARKLTFGVVGLVSDRLASFLTSKVEKLADGLSFLPDLRHSGPFLRDTLVYWLVNGLGMWVALRGCGVPASVNQACVVMGLLGVGMLMPAGPGFLGAFQMSCYCALATYFAPDVVLGPGAAAVFVLYATQMSITVITGLAGLAMLGGDTNDAT